MSEWDPDALTDSDVMPFGKYKDFLLGDVPASYLLWLTKQKWSKEYPALVAYINNLDDDENDE